MKSQLPNLDKNLAGFRITCDIMNIEKQKVSLLCWQHRQEILVK